MQPLRIRPDLRQRVWGGDRLTPAGAPPVGEAWLAGPWSDVLDGEAEGETLERLAATHGARLTGDDAGAPDRFPMLAKIIDPAEWLSVQVHPDDDQARRLEGPTAIGKTEAWYVVEAAPDAEILLGVRRGVEPETVRHAVREGGLAGLLERRRVAAGEAYLVPAGTLHAIGPGVLVYEIQQPSDITYRCDDWGRPPSAARPLHVEQALACVHAIPWQDRIASSSGPGAQGILVSCEHFVLEYVRPAAVGQVSCDPGMASVHMLTAVSGSARVSGDGWEEALEPFGTLVVPACAEPYRIEATDLAHGSRPDSLVLLARLPRSGKRERR